MLCFASAPSRSTAPRPVSGPASGGASPSVNSSSDSLRSVWHWVRAKPRVHPAPSLAHWGDRLAWCLTQPDRPRSLQPLVFPSMPGAGKLALSYGATLVGRGIGREERGEWVPGAVAMAVGVCVVLWGIVALGNAVGHVHRPGGPWLKLGAIAGGVAMGVGYGLSAYASAVPDTPWAAGAGIALKWAGTSATAFTLPTLVVHGVAVLGDLPFHRHRGPVAAALLAVGAPTLVASPALVSASGLPVAGSQAVVVLASFACLLAAGIYGCALPSAPYQPSAHRASTDRLERWGGTTALVASIVGVGGSVACSSLVASGHVTAMQAQGAAGGAGVACAVAATIFVRALSPWPGKAFSTPLAAGAMPAPPTTLPGLHAMAGNGSFELASLTHDKV